MELLKKHFGRCATNAYILKSKIGDFIIDPGENSANWIIENAKNPIAILNTHGHFDHIWCNKELKEKFNIPIFCPKEDAFMLENDNFNLGFDTCSPDVKVNDKDKFYFGENGLDSTLDSKQDSICVEYMRFSGHTPGCSIIKIDNYIFSGDFIFNRGIGRVDLPYSNANEMKESLKRFKSFPYSGILYPGHGENTSVEEEKKNIDLWIETLC